MERCISYLQLVLKAVMQCEYNVLIQGGRRISFNRCFLQGLERNIYINSLSLLEAQNEDLCPYMYHKP